MLKVSDCKKKKKRQFENDWYFFFFYSIFVTLCETHKLSLWRIRRPHKTTKKKSTKNLSEIIATWKLEMMPQGDTESKKSMGDVTCFIIVLLSADSLHNQRKIQRWCIVANGEQPLTNTSHVPNKEQAPILQVDLWKPGML